LTNQVINPKRKHGKTLPFFENLFNEFPAF
jgi:hypothetical protein